MMGWWHTLGKDPMNKRAYDRDLKMLNNGLKFLEERKKTHIYNFKMNCSHPARSLTVTRIEHDDEYGKWVPGWAEYHYRCKRCDSRATLPKQIASVAELRAAFRKETERKPTCNRSQ